MLLFGGNLSGGKKAKPAAVANASNSLPSDQAGDESGEAGGILTPHTDALHRLTNHELRLLEELERTRSKLQAEWRLKVANLQRQHPETLASTLNNVHEAAVPNVEELEKRFQLAMGGGRPPVPNDLQRAMHSKTLKLSRTSAPSRS